jgi:hypothetical protein
MTLDQRVQMLSRTVAQAIGVLNIHGRILTRGFFGRFKWLFFGR